MTTTTVSNTQMFSALSATSPKFIPIREYKILSAQSPDFITTRAYEDNTPTVTATHSYSFKTGIKTSISSKNIAFLLEKLGKLPELVPTSSKRLPLPTPDESLIKWQTMDYSNIVSLLPSPFDVNTTNQNLTSNTPPSSTSTSISTSRSTTTTSNLTTSPSASSSPPSSSTTTSNTNESPKSTAPTEEDPEAFRTRIQAANELRWIQADAEHAARQEKWFRDAGIVVGEQEITEIEIWLWGHPTLGIYRCSDPSPLRSWMAYA